MMPAWSKPAQVQKVTRISERGLPDSNLAFQIEVVAVRIGCCLHCSCQVGAGIRVAVGLDKVKSLCAKTLALGGVRVASLATSLLKQRQRER